MNSYQFVKIIALSWQEKLGEKKQVDAEQLKFVRASAENVREMLAIIHRCLNEVCVKDYGLYNIEKYRVRFTEEWLRDIITSRHYYEVWRGGTLIGCGGVSRDFKQERQSYFTAVFINPDYHRKGIGRRFIEFLEGDEWCLDSTVIEVPASKSGCEFYRKCGYHYRTYPPVFSETDGATIMYKIVKPGLE